ncbi:formate/nitrite transporter family protein [Candidatus Saccharibacteria bacterium]|nr:formate/nitrite transporter family protein [Candidatus Saccharibacteria bacterium]
MQTPSEVVENSFAVAQAKAGASVKKLLILGFLAGAFIAFAAEASNMVAMNLLSSPEMYGLGRLVAGAVFAVGLMLVVLTGSELFTGNVLMTGAAIKKKIRWSALLRNWILVYLANMAGAVFIAALMYFSGLFHASGDLLGGLTVKIAAGKTALDFMPALILGVLCNWLVCLAVWLAWTAKTFPGKILAIFFPIMLFVASGFEHSVANMYYISAGMFAATDPAYVAAATDIGLSSASFATLNPFGFFVSNLIPVTIGNIMGGVVFVGLAYAYANQSTPKKKPAKK